MGDLSEEDVEGIMTGSVGDPTVGQVAALASVFGLGTSYVLDRGEAPLDAGLVRSIVGRDDSGGGPRDLAPVRTGETPSARDRTAVRGPERGVASPGRQDNCLIGALLPGWRKSRGQQVIRAFVRSTARYESRTTKSPELIFSAVLGDDGTRNVRFERAYST